MEKKFNELNKKSQRKLLKEAKLTRRSIAKSKGVGELSKQKLREKAYKEMRKFGG